jgi:hypothetical protein
MPISHRKSNHWCYCCRKPCSKSRVTALTCLCTDISCDTRAQQSRCGRVIRGKKDQIDNPDVPHRAHHVQASIGLSGLGFLSWASAFLRMLSCYVTLIFFINVL